MGQRVPAHVRHGLYTQVKSMFSLKDPGLLRQQAYVDGQWRAAESGKTLDVINPANNEPLGTIPACDAADTRAAIEAANQTAGMECADHAPACSGPAQVARTHGGSCR
ncbi:hypothetical protein LMG23994_06088 [Cupriavidus pinatubonensis]|uniref:Aldehyde dehydrogenase domain-containing protein n=1 Tax=Cupriavidus pinatubonensis TaxID=248026 RepID=A0ABM8Y0B3_9BURK|nr:hypothetical protein LMG23994_06088 [Cupriavidus pinatubonensis]